MSKFYGGERSIRGYLNEIEKYYELMKKSKDSDHYLHYLTLVKNQIEFMSRYIYEMDKLEEFKHGLDHTGIDNNMCASIIKTVELNIHFMVKGMAYTQFKKEREHLKKWQNLLNLTTDAEAK